MITGYIYLIVSDYGVKIGRATNFLSRFSQIYVSSPIELVLYRVYKVNNVISAEDKLHSLFHDRNIRGEWFSLTSDDVEQIPTFLKANKLLEGIVELNNEQYKIEKIIEKANKNNPYKEINKTVKMEYEAKISYLESQIQKLEKQLFYLRNKS